MLSLPTPARSVTATLPAIRLSCPSMATLPSPIRRSVFSAQPSSASDESIRSLILRKDGRGKSGGVLPHLAEGGVPDAASWLRPHHQHHGNDRRTADGDACGGPCRSDERRPKCRYSRARH